MKKPVAASNFFASVSLLMMTLPIEVKPRFFHSEVMEKAFIGRGAARFSYKSNPFLG
ncbi:uncharacterized protein METZ01_LOCUS174558 [marine metagenome]|uniref:Uncharacterized protein n=1 Tax=marine metagenome TaxID=408172 RepID=A0A382C740_9ZZZZ